MDIIIYLCIFIVSAIVFYFIGRKTTKREDKLSNDEVLRQRALIQEQIDDKKQILHELKNEETVQRYEAIENAKKIADEFYNQKIEMIEKDIEQAREEKLRSLEDELNQKLEAVAAVSSDLCSLKTTYASAIEAMRREQTVEEHPEIYCMQFADDELHDMDYLNQIKPKLRHPEILGKVIWSTFMQKKYNNFATTILGPNDVCGVYKITDQLTREAYIGQSLNIKTRWRDHMKCGVGATSASSSNQLYAAMRRDGIENFSFELLDECPKEDLYAKEKYFIELYQTDKVGLNSTRGNEG